MARELPISARSFYETSLHIFDVFARQDKDHHLYKLSKLFYKKVAITSESLEKGTVHFQFAHVEADLNFEFESEYRCLFRTITTKRDIDIAGHIEISDTAEGVLVDYRHSYNKISRANRIMINQAAKYLFPISLEVILQEAKRIQLASSVSPAG